MQQNLNTGLPVNATALPLFRWADSRPVESISLETLPPAARQLANRFGLPPSRARVVAELAGFNVEASYV